ncbi:HD domain-containing protein [Aneurinibacillus sp. Ricciae_BoGa-3]|uniref:HD-GYP domain-containing protein n=1 Tax=Aneurinibacillus sp. Ricciae_BoGa-3 TaxID=3022697 RepID=UPI002340AA0A|nr:HD domain-containing phosphohydrolase [Aneurinibacillus sp. Ricciae_BoGa-3]WCK55579.1 HD domain-containing protein [Aneurinibacillus sp. Ricciae_BoGa-3]
MRHTSIESVESGQVLGKSIYTSDGRTLLHANVLLTPMMITQLRRIGVTMLYIKDKHFADVHIEDMVSEKTRRETLSQVSESMQCVQDGKNIDMKNVTKTVTNMVDEIVGNKNILLQLDDVRTKDNHLFIHSLNVCMTSTIIGINLGYNADKLRDLALGALFHDIGKVVKENDPIRRNTDKKDQEHHAWVGFNVLRKKHELNLASAHVSLQHHEHVDGTGLPRGLKNDEIHEYAKIVAVANYYDNLISEFSSEPTYMPYQASEFIMGLAGRHFDHTITVNFLRSIALYPTGTSVKLNTGEIGVIVGQHKGLPSRPIVRVIRKKNGDSFNFEEPEVKEIDLATATTIFIEEVLN